MNKIRFKLIIYDLIKIILLSLCFSPNLFALTLPEKELLLSSYTLGLQDTPINILKFTEKDLKADPRFARTKLVTEQAQIAYSYAVEEIKKVYVNLKNLKIIHPNGLFESSYEYFNNIPGSSISIPIENQKTYNLYKKFLELSPVKQRTNLSIYIDSNYDQFPWNLNAYSFSLVVLDHILRDWIRTKSLNDIKTRLRRIMDKVPFLLFTVPELQKGPILQEVRRALSNPINFFPQDGLVNVKKIPGTDNSYLAIKNGTLIDGVLYNGKLTINDGNSVEALWYNENYIIKEYWNEKYNQVMLTELDTNIETFINACSKINFNSIPNDIIKKKEQDKLALIFTVSNNKYISLKDQDIKFILNQILTMLLKLNQMNIKVKKFNEKSLMIDQNNKVILVDFNSFFLNQKSDILDFLTICWNFTHKGSEQSFESNANLIKNSKAEDYGPVLSLYVRPILDEKVKSLKDLSEILAEPSDISMEDKLLSKESLNTIYPKLESIFCFYQGIKVAHPHPSNKESSTFFKPYSGQVTYLYSNNMGRKLSTDHEILIDDIDFFYNKFQYREFDLIILDTLFKEWCILHMDEWVLNKLNELINLAPFVAILPTKGSMGQYISTFFNSIKKQNPNSLLFTIHAYRLKDTNQDVFFLVKDTVSVDGQYFKGDLIHYTSNSFHTIWINPDYVLKEYIINEKNNEYSRNIKFYEKCKKLGIKNISHLISTYRTNNTGIIVTRNSGTKLLGTLDKIDKKLLSFYVNQIVDTLIIFEVNNFTPYDLQAGNILINETHQIYFIDFDLALFDKSPDLSDYLNIILTITNKFVGAGNLKKNLNLIPLNSYSPILQPYVKPVLERTVSNFKELKQYITKSGL